jgi:aminoglycoside phosphotransferase (APT) family kinase protein
VQSLEKVAEGREAEMFAWGEGRLLRLFHAGRSAEEAERQALLMQRIGESGVRVPRVYDRVVVDGRHGIVVERVDGADLLTFLGRQPWRLAWAAAICGRVQAALNATPAIRGLPETPDRLARYILDPEYVPPRLAEIAIDRLRRLPRGDRLCHGDFHPGNLMMQGDEPVVIDWTNATAGPAEADFARTRVLLAIGEPPPGTALHVRLAASTLGKIFAALYAQAYRRHSRVNEILVDAWRLPIAISRLSEGIGEERRRLLALIERLLPAA